MKLLSFLFFLIALPCWASGDALISSEERPREYGGAYHIPSSFQSLEVSVIGGEVDKNSHIVTTISLPNDNFFIVRPDVTTLQEFSLNPISFNSIKKASLRSYLLPPFYTEGDLIFESDSDCFARKKRPSNMLLFNFYLVSKDRGEVIRHLFSKNSLELKTKINNIFPQYTKLCLSIHASEYENYKTSLSFKEGKKYRPLFYKVDGIRK